MLKLQLMISLGFSPCPNDTFIFYAIAEKRTDTAGLDFDIRIEDVETLNQLAMSRALDVTKVSCHAFYYLQDDYQFLKTGGAFGRGCGPLIVQKTENRSQKAGTTKIAIPGELTTAFLLLKLYLSSISQSTIRNPQFIAMPFHKIMTAVRDGSVDAGLIIHESRFTYHEYGLKQIADLGEWWENETGLPIPLGGIIAKKSLGMAKIKTIEDIIKTSVKYSLSHQSEAMRFIKRYSAELSDDVIMKHISLYVNDYTINIGDEGETALDELLKRTAYINKQAAPEELWRH
ncbi:MAG: 1,4-dihydroxy-6-naphthoate synthase [Thermodesulfovibrionales bacterium]|nr:1,4-dihydroxy-6-naphthoate synthase [Thermodesulfovibrionales bacterium]